MPRRPPQFTPVEPPRTDPSVWSDGALTVEAAEAFSGLSRSTLYALMGAGTLAWGRPHRFRLIARRSLVAYLAAGAAGGGS